MMGTASTGSGMIRSKSVAVVNIKVGFKFQNLHCKMTRKLNIVVDMCSVHYVPFFFPGEGPSLPPWRASGLSLTFPMGTIICALLIICLLVAISIDVVCCKINKTGKYGIRM